MSEQAMGRAPAAEAAGELQPKGVWRVLCWLGLILSEVGITASLALFLMGAPLVLAAGGYVASGGPYEIAHPITAPMWIYPVGMTGLVLAGWGQKIFSAILDAPRLVYASLTVFLIGLSAMAFSASAVYPSGDGRHLAGLIWGIIGAVGAVALVVIRFTTTKTIEWKRSNMTGRPLAIFWVVTVMALGLGAFLGLRIGLGVVS